MNQHSFVSSIRAFIPLSLFIAFAVWQPAVHAETRHVVIESDGSLSKEAARQSSEEWNATRSLRHKVNSRDEKTFDKMEKARASEEKCNASDNVNAYWEANTERCLDRRTGRSVTP